MADKDYLLSALDAIDPASLVRNDWRDVGMGLHYEGFPCSAWDSWSQRDPLRYVPDECAKMWDHFDDNKSNPVTGGTIVKLAKDRGWSWKRSDGSMSWDDVIEDDGEAKPTIPEKRTPAEDLILYLQTLFDPEDVIGYVTDSYWKDKKWVPASKGAYNRTAGELIDSLKKNSDIAATVGSWRPEAGAWIRFNPLDGKGTTDKNVTKFRYALVESDDIPVEDQEETFRRLQLPIAALVNSGGKSIHAIVHVDAGNSKEYKDRVAFLYSYMKDQGISIDGQNKNPSRLSRMPGITRGDKQQSLIAVNIGKRSWDEWKKSLEVSQDLTLTSLATVEEKEPDWLISGLISKGSIATLAAEGGAGKTTIICSIAAAISRGDPTFLERIPEGWGKRDPGKIFLFSGEDSLEYTLKRRLRKNNANLENIFSIDIADDRFQHVKFGDPFLEQILEANKPDLCVFDPIQAFVPPDIHMGDRNAMRNCLAPLIGFGEKFGTTFIIVVHSNKQAGVYGRKRIADSADIWDISRSVLMVGETSEKGVRYVSNEKNNYGPLAKTTLFRLSDEQIQYAGTTDKRDKDFVTEQTYTQQQAPARNEAEDFILEYLGDGEKPVAELDEAANAMSISKRTLQRAKSELKTAGKLKYRSTGQGKDKQFFVSLIPIATENLA